ncbi:hypothetical protein SDC9_208052 [bioreactor metagenome]|uniref:IrrE N-terminal-like domain-containing protein n=1 Tax=bioreactor metagenome TaxID=1076179 RepID=A0A645JJ05_9ZZZZ
MPKCSSCTRIRIAVKTDNSTWNRLLDLATKKNIIVYMSDLSATVNGIYFQIGDMGVIGIKNSLADSKNFVLAHELGHSVLHKNYGDQVFTQSDNDRQRIQKAELEADRFAEKLIKLLERRYVK